MDISITKHAVDRYRERVDATQSASAVLLMLIQKSKTAKKLKTRTRGGQEQWVAGDTVFICKNDPCCGLVAVTVGRYEEDCETDWIATEAELDRQHWEARMAKILEDEKQAAAIEAKRSAEIAVLLEGIAQRDNRIQLMRQAGNCTQLNKLLKRQEKSEKKLRELRDKTGKESADS